MLQLRKTVRNKLFGNGETSNQTSHEQIDDKIERWEEVTIYPHTYESTNSFRVVARDPSGEDESGVFDEVVDFISLNGTRLPLDELDEKVELNNGIVFDYYWSLETASLDLLTSSAR